MLEGTSRLLMGTTFDGKCFCCWERVESSGGCIRCSSRTVCMCGSLLRCGCGFEVKDHDCSLLKSLDIQTDSIYTRSPLGSHELR